MSCVYILGLAASVSAVVCEREHTSCLHAAPIVQHYPVTTWQGVCGVISHQPCTLLAECVCEESVCQESDAESACLPGDPM